MICTAVPPFSVRTISHMSNVITWRRLLIFIGYRYKGYSLFLPQLLYDLPVIKKEDVGCRSNFDPSRPLYTQDTSFSVKSSLTAICQGVQTLSTDIFACHIISTTFLNGNSPLLIAR